MRRCDIEEVLLKIGVPAGIAGFTYIADAILMLNDDPMMRATKELYPMIAKKNNSTDKKVERAIRHAFDVARESKGNYEIVEHYIGFIHCTNVNSLKLLYSRMKAEEKDQQNHVCESPDEEMIRRIVREELKNIMGGIS